MTKKMWGFFAEFGRWSFWQYIVAVSLANMTNIIHCYCNSYIFALGSTFIWNHDIYTHASILLLLIGQNENYLLINNAFEVCIKSVNERTTSFANVI